MSLAICISWLQQELDYIEFKKTFWLHLSLGRQHSILAKLHSNAATTFARGIDLTFYTLAQGATVDCSYNSKDVSFLHVLCDG